MLAIIRHSSTRVFLTDLFQVLEESGMLLWRQDVATAKQRPRQPVDGDTDVVDELPLAQRHLPDDARVNFRSATAILSDDVTRQDGADVRPPLACNIDVKTLERRVYFKTLKTVKMWELRKKRLKLDKKRSSHFNDHRTVNVRRCQETTTLSRLHEWNSKLDTSKLINSSPRDI